MMLYGAYQANAQGMVMRTPVRDAGRLDGGWSRFEAGVGLPTKTHR